MASSTDTGTVGSLPLNQPPTLVTKKAGLLAVERTTTYTPPPSGTSASRELRRWLMVRKPSNPWPAMPPLVSDVIATLIHEA